MDLQLDRTGSPLNLVAFSRHWAARIDEARRLKLKADRWGLVLNRIRGASLQLGEERELSYLEIRNRVITEVWRRLDRA